VNLNVAGQADLGTLFANAVAALGGTVPPVDPPVDPVNPLIAQLKAALMALGVPEATAATMAVSLVSSGWTN
jgi:hypothetical protein